MITIIKKGIEITEYKNGSKSYKPYVQLSEKTHGERLYVQPYQNLFFLNKNGFMSSSSEARAIEILDEAILRFKKTEQEKIDTQIVKKYEKEIK